MILAHRIALDPTTEQRIALTRACGVARFTWNWALAQWDAKYKAGEKPTAVGLKKVWNQIKQQDYPWVYESPKDCNQQPFANLQTAFNRFFKKQARRPTFKRRGVHDSFYVSNDKFVVIGFMVRLPVIGFVRMREQLRFAGKIMAATISREADRWFIAIQVETQVKALPAIDKTVGIDLGLTTTVVCSDGQTFDSPKPLRHNLERLRRRCRQHSRKHKGSNNRRKSSRRLARLHARIANVRKDWTHKVTTRLIHENQVVCLEDLNVRGMQTNRRLARAISDVGWYELRRQLAYKAEMYGRKVVAIARFFPSSKKCSNCGHVKESMPLSERVYRCDSCSFEADRDFNAARNIHTAGLAGIYACGPEGAGSICKGRTKPCRVETGTRPGAHSRALTN